MGFASVQSIEFKFMDQAKNADNEFMRQLRTGLTNNGGLTRRQMMTRGVLGLTGWMLSPIRIAAGALQDDLERVSHIPQMNEREGPLLVFRDVVADPDVEVEQHIRLQLGQRKELLALLKKKIGFDKQVRLSVEDLHVRLMFVPQLQEGHAAAAGASRTSSCSGARTARNGKRPTPPTPRACRSCHARTSRAAR